ncbi:imidazole glycerol phosphate synthase subunit HisH [Rubrolithibacter danxiaensis]|uniref:imidazole glycerol phosphate synthase subunit HisH n=1 Tax=Rubrolithibacter danxiaensis TaxID=3390805 RepID=UPI003BF7E474
MEKKDVGIVYYGAGNLFSLTAALDRQQVSYGMITSADEFDLYDRYIIPGVGHAGAAMQKLEETGFVPLIKELKKPVLGICVGMQLLTDFSEEGSSSLTSIIPLNTVQFNAEILKLKVPHMGWNKVTVEFENELFKGIENNSYFYFVHSYFIEFNSKFTLASADYGIKFSASVKKDNFFGVQFHPEKSGEAGEKILKNFTYLN